MSCPKFSVAERTEYLIFGYMRQFVELIEVPIDFNVNEICMSFLGPLFEIESDLLPTNEDKQITKRHERSAKEFHAKCDNKGTTITIIQNDINYVFGGYTTAPWSCVSGYKHDENAFLFFIKCENETIKPKTFDLLKPMNAVYHFEYSMYPSDHIYHYGPWFGSGDIIIWTGDHKRCKCCLTTYHGTTFDLCGHNTNSTYFHEFDYEVFQLL
eukprot:499190_1